MPYFYMLTSAPIQKTDAAYVLEERAYVRAKDARSQLEVLRNTLVDPWGGKVRIYHGISALPIWIYVGGIYIPIF